MNEKEIISLARHDMKRVITRAKKEFGTIERGQEDYYTPSIFSIEQEIYNTNKEISLSENELQEVIEMVIYDIKGIIEDKIYDYSSIREEKQILFTKKLVFFLNPFVNDKIEIDKEKLNNKKELFTLPIMCLLRIYDSIEFWNKNSGRNGYYKMLEEMIMSQLY